MVNEDGKIEIGVGVNTEELDKYSKKLDKILKQMQQVNGSTVKSTSSVKSLDDKTKKLIETSRKTVSGNGSNKLSLSPLLNKIPMYSKLSGSLGNIGSGVNRIKESVSFGRDATGNIQNKTEHLSKSFEKLSTKTNVAQARLGAIAEKGGIVGKAAGGLGKGFSKLGPLMTRITGLIGRVGVALGPIGIALGVVAGLIGGVILAITGMITATAVATKKMKEFASTADNLVKERRSYDPTTATEAGAYRQGLIRQTGKLADKLGRLATTLANSDVIKFSGTLDVMKRRYSNVDDALDRHAKTTMRVTAFMDTLGIYLDSLKMGVLDLIEPIFSNTELLKGLATAIDVVTTPLMWIGKGLAIFAQKIGEVLSVIGSLVSGVVQFVSEIPILGDFIKDCLNALDAKSSHAARDFVDDMENVFKKYESGYYKDPYKYGNGLYNTSFMDFEEERSPTEETKNDDKDVTNSSLNKLLDNTFQKSTKPLLDSGFNLIDDGLGIILSTIKNLGESILKGWGEFSNFVSNIGQTIQTKWDSFTQTFTGWMSQLKENASNLISGFKENVGILASNIMKNASNLISGFKENVGILASNIMNNASNLMSSIKNRISSALPNIASKISNLLSNIGVSSKSVLSPLKNIGDKLTTVMKHLNNIVSNTAKSSSGGSSSGGSSSGGSSSGGSSSGGSSSGGSSSGGSSSGNFNPTPKQDPLQANDYVPPSNGGNSNAKLKGSSGSQASEKTTPPKAYLKNSMSFTQVPYHNSNAFTLPETQASTSARNSNKSLELSNSSRSSSTGQGNELKILDPRDVDIKININTEKADKDFVEKMTETLKKSFLDGLLHGY